jgi:NitT/TauT family transport system permease protein
VSPGRRALAQAGLLVAAVSAWQAASALGWVDPLFVPSPRAVLGALPEVGPEVLGTIGGTAAKTLASYLLAVVAGVSLGLLLGGAGHLYTVLGPFVVAGYALPKILVLPWFLMTLGLGSAPAVAYGAVQGVFPICLLVAGGVRDLDPRLLTVARAFGATRWQLYRAVILPAVLPAVVAGMRLGIVFCLLGVLVVEMFGGLQGMGFLLTSLANAFRAPELFAATAMVSILSATIVVGLEGLSRRMDRRR